MRSVESASIHVLRAIEDEGVRRRSAEIHVHVAGAVAMYILNQKRDRLMAIERTHGMQVILLVDDRLVPPQDQAWTRSGPMSPPRPQLRPGPRSARR